MNYTNCKMCVFLFSIWILFNCREHSCNHKHRRWTGRVGVYGRRPSSFCCPYFWQWVHFVFIRTISHLKSHENQLPVVNVRNPEVNLNALAFYQKGIFLSRFTKNSVLILTIWLLSQFNKKFKWINRFSVCFT